MPTMNVALKADMPKSSRWTKTKVWIEGVFQHLKVVGFDETNIKIPVESSQAQTPQVGLLCTKTADV